jgi:hypothetical protein
VRADETNYLQITEVDYEGDQFLTLGLAQFDSEAECVAAYDGVAEVDEDPNAPREYKIDRFSGLARVDEKFIASATVVELLRCDLIHLHDQAAAALDHEVSDYLRTADAE